MIVPLGVVVCLLVWKSAASLLARWRWAPTLLAAGFIVLFAVSNAASARVLEKAGLTFGRMVTLPGEETELKLFEINV
jgi:hypothetical protein